MWAAPAVEEMSTKGMGGEWAGEEGKWEEGAIGYGAISSRGGQDRVET